ncbi:MAG: sn-glycerol-3-phosphate ABC transporter ATP-binding protein UgpC [Gammaproteobacteria bacterium]|nr:sn-glycerol-3-phosphate ABC transporter ATP-binding protein UgpC [Gammaproteobacteria bacterium]MDH3464765.1 sn-glycerol-3-phosphate ABC transporter ATP-binding protein UgpC [Gammaproteobacteria bacterium]
MSTVLLQGLTKRFGTSIAVDSVNLAIEHGEFVVLVGPSGSGKTTCLRMIAGLETVSSGSIFIGDRDVANIHAKDRDVAMVFQSYALYPHMTVAQNLGFALKLREIPRDEIKRRVKDVAKILGITEELPRKPKTLSGGQQQRVALGRAIVRDPAVFLFDEPLSNLDAKLRVAMRVELVKLHHRLGATMIYVTHDQVEAMTMADRIVVMHEGLIQQIGAPLTVYDDPENVFVAGFIGSPTMNLLPGELNRRNDHLNFRTGDLELNLLHSYDAVISGSVTLGVRPEFLSIKPNNETATLDAKVEAVEHLGSETILELSTAGPPLTAKIARNDSVQHGDNIRIGIEHSKILAFNSSSGERLRV